MDTCSQAFSFLNEVVSNHALNQAIEGFTLGFQDESLVLSLGCPLKSPNPIENTKPRGSKGTLEGPTTLKSP